MRKVGAAHIAVSHRDVTHVQLLRRFHDIVLSVSIEEKEECPICMDTLEVNKSVR